MLSPGVLLALMKGAFALAVTRPKEGNLAKAFLGGSSIGTTGALASVGCTGAVAGCSGKVETMAFDESTATGAGGRSAGMRCSAGVFGGVVSAWGGVVETVVGVSCSWDWVPSQ